jgi:hypothetical protein
MTGGTHIAFISHDPTVVDMRGGQACGAKSTSTVVPAHPTRTKSAGPFQTTSLRDFFVCGGLPTRGITMVVGGRFNTAVLSMLQPAPHAHLPLRYTRTRNCGGRPQFDA